MTFPKNIFKSEFKLFALIFFAVLSAKTQAAQTTATCIPDEVAQIDGRVHIRCQQPISDAGVNIWWFALPTSGNGDESKTAQRFIAMGLSAIATGKSMYFWFGSGDTSGLAYGCGPENCRRPAGFSLLK